MGPRSGWASARCHRLASERMKSWSVSPRLVPAKLPSTVQLQWIRCGKPNCGRERGKLHGPYWYRFWRDDEGPLRKEYVKQADLEAARAACEATRVEVREMRRALTRGTRLGVWLEGRDGREPADPNEALEYDFRMLGTLAQWVRVASGQQGSPRHSVRAMELLTEPDLRWLGFQGLKGLTAAWGAASSASESLGVEAWALLKRTPSALALLSLGECAVNGRTAGRATGQLTCTSSSHLPQ